MFYFEHSLADIPCVIINGMSKSGTYEVGGPVVRDDLQAQWNAVYVNGGWWPVDTFWATTCVSRKTSSNRLRVDSKGNMTRMHEGGKPDFSVNEFYFLTEPIQLIWTHLPDKPEWQLSELPINMNDFKRMAYVREQYHKLGLIMDETHKDCVIKTSGQHVNMTLGIPPDKGSTIKFKYAFLQTRRQVESEKEIDIVLERFVRLDHKYESLAIRLRFPMTGKFIFDLYAINLSESSPSYELVLSYSILCSEKSSNHLPYPDCPELGWGPTPSSHQMGIIPIIPSDTVLETETGICQIVVEKTAITRIGHALKNVLMDEAILSRHSMAYHEEDRYIVDVRLPKPGEYALKIFASNDKNNAPKSNNEILTFLVYFKKPDRGLITHIPYPHIAGGHLGLTEAADQLEVFPLTYKQHVVDLPEGQGSFVFKSKEDINLICELSSSNRESISRMTCVTKHEKTRWIFEIDAPIAGEYSLNVFAFQAENPTCIQNIYSYLINSNGRPIKEVKFNDEQFTEDIISESMKFPEHELNIPVPMPMDDEAIYATIQRRDAKTSSCLEDTPTVDILRDYLRVNFPDDGEYMMDVYEKDIDNSLITIARFTFSRADYFKTYTDDIDGLLKILKPDDMKKKAKQNKKKMMEKKDKQLDLLKKKSKEHKQKEKKEIVENTITENGTTVDSPGTNDQENVLAFGKDQPETNSPGSDIDVGDDALDSDHHNIEDELVATIATANITETAENDHTHNHDTEEHDKSAIDTDDMITDSSIIDASETHLPSNQNDDIEKKHKEAEGSKPSSEKGMVVISNGVVPQDNNTNQTKRESISNDHQYNSIGTLRPITTITEKSEIGRLQDDSDQRVQRSITSDPDRNTDSVFLDGDTGVHSSLLTALPVVNGDAGIDEERDKINTNKDQIEITQKRKLKIKTNRRRSEMGRRYSVNIPQITATGHGKKKFKHGNGGSRNDGSLTTRSLKDEDIRSQRKTSTHKGIEDKRIRKNGYKAKHRIDTVVDAGDEVDGDHSDLETVTSVGQSFNGTIFSSGEDSYTDYSDDDMTTEEKEQEAIKRKKKEGI